MLGYVSRERVLSLMARASIYALPAKYEPFGLSALEAAASGCALVLGNIPSLREIWGDAAVYVPPNQPDMLASTLRSLIANPERLRDCAQAARERAREYTQERMTRGYLELYAQLQRGLSVSAYEETEAEV
jgi:glycosyltransferase involved in cell wall biosynthesis